MTIAKPDSSVTRKQNTLASSPTASLPNSIIPPLHHFPMYLSPTASLPHCIILQCISPPVSLPHCITPQCISPLQHRSPTTVSLPHCITPRGNQAPVSPSLSFLQTQQQNLVSANKFLVISRSGLGKGKVKGNMKLLSDIPLAPQTRAFWKRN